jgi:hypothetical protein
MFSERKDKYKQQVTDGLQTMQLASKELASEFVERLNIQQIMEVAEMLPTFQQVLFYNIIPNKPASHMFFHSDIGVTKDTTVNSKKIFSSEADFKKFDSVSRALLTDDPMMYHINKLARVMGKMFHEWGSNSVQAFELIHNLRGDQLDLADSFSQDTKYQACVQISQKKIDNVEALHAELRKNFNEQVSLLHLKSDFPGPMDNKLPDNIPIDLELLDPVLGKFEEDLIDTYLTPTFVDDVQKAYDALNLVALSPNQRGSSYSFVSDLTAAGIHALPEFLMTMLDESIQLIQSPIGQSRDLIKSVLFAKMQEKNSDENGHPILESYQLNNLITDSFLKNLNALPNVIGFDQFRSLPQNLLEDNTRQLQESFFILSEGGKLDGHNITLHSLPVPTGFMQNAQNLNYYVGLAILGTLAGKLFLDKALVPLLSPWARAVGPWLRNAPAARDPEQERLLEQGQAGTNDLRSIEIEEYTPDEVAPSSIRKRRHSEPLASVAKKETLFNTRKEGEHGKETKISPGGKPKNYRK